jgi:tripartite-type tricarboxylate transporter receptor subunit TctC
MRNNVMRESNDMIALSRRGFLALSLCAAMTSGAAAENWPTRAVSLVVPYAAGGHTDMARLLADYLTKTIGQQPFIVENRPGAGGALATTYVADSVPDGHTLLFGSVAQISIVPYVQKVRFDREKSFIPISIFGGGVIALVSNAQVPVKSVAELISYAKAHPGNLNYSSAGFGSFSHLGAAMLASRAGIELTHIPYKGASPAVQAVATGEVQVYIGNRAELLPLAQSGKIRLLGVATSERVPDWPDVPTIASTLPGFQMGGWQGLLAPAKTPANIVARLEREAMAAAKAPLTLERLARLPANAVGSTSAAFAETIRKEGRLYQEAVAAAGIKIKD